MLLVLIMDDTESQTSEDKEPAVPLDTNSKGGAWVDFESSRIKEKWRIKEADFIDRSFPKNPKKRADLRVLCTPGIKCHKEVDHLIRIGIRPDNIVAVERERRAWKEFEKNCREKGIRPVYGDLKDILKEKNLGSFDIVTLDFLGQMCLSSARIIQRLSLSTKAALAVNFLAKRENQRTQASLNKTEIEYTLAQDANLDAQEDVVEALRSKDPKFAKLSIRELLKIVREKKEEKVADVDFHVSETRETGIWSLLRHAGCLCRKNWNMRHILKDIRFPQQAVGAEENEDWDVFLRNVLRKTCSDIFFPDILELTAWLKAQKLYKSDGRGFNLDAIALATAFNLKQMTKFEKYKYKSRVGKTSSPFFANMAILESSPDCYRGFERSAEFMLKAAQSLINDKADGLNTNYRFEIKKVGPIKALTRSDEIVGVRIDLRRSLLARLLRRPCPRKQMQKIRIGQLVDDLTNFNQLMRGNLLNDPKFAARIPRVELE